LQLLATHKDADVSSAASAALRADGPESVLAELRPLLSHGDAAVRAAAVAAIGATAPAPAIADLVTVYEQDEQFAVRTAAQRALAKGGEPVRRLIVEWIRAGDKSTADDRSKVALAISIARDMKEEAAPLVPDLLELAGTPYRHAAHYALLKIGAPAAEKVVEVLETNPLAEDVVFHIGSPATPFLLRKIETTTDERAKLLALRSLNARGAAADSVYPVLIRLIENRSEENLKFRRGAIAALAFQRYEQVDPVPVLSAIAKDQGDPYRDHAESVLRSRRRAKL
jgi:HEAT repeat protein